MSALVIQQNVGTHVRYGCFLGTIPLTNRVGDYAHCACRILNAVFKRLAADAPQAAKTDLARFVQTVSDDNACIPIIDRMFTRYKKEGTMDLSQTRFFLTSATLLPNLIALIEKHQGTKKVVIGGKEVAFHVPVRVLLTALKTLYHLWHQHSYLTDDQLTLYDSALDRFTKSWVALNWKPTIWVHWTVAHSSFYVHRLRSLYIFSSIPSEKRHQYFKRDLRHCFQGWKLSRTFMHQRGLVHVVTLSGLD